MSQELTITKVMETLQGVLHDLHDLSLRSGQPFQGIVIESLEFQYRDFGPSRWSFTIEPSLIHVGDPNVGWSETPEVAPEENIGEAPVDPPEDDEDA